MYCLWCEKLLLLAAAGAAWGCEWLEEEEVGWVEVGEEGVGWVGAEPP
jgi:hypothetical protein